MAYEERPDEKIYLQAIAARAESRLKEMELFSRSEADTLLAFKDNVEMMSFFSAQKQEDRKITFLIYENNELIAWSGSDVTFASIDDILNTGQTIVHLPNGWYKVLTMNRGNRRARNFYFHLQRLLLPE
jgi:hypothetical protein